jgi:nitrate reductase NapE component
MKSIICINKIVKYNEVSMKGLRRKRLGAFAFEYIIVLVIMAVAVFGGFGTMSSAIQNKANDVECFVKANGQNALDNSTNCSNDYTSEYQDWFNYQPTGTDIKNQNSKEEAIQYCKSIDSSQNKTGDKYSVCNVNDNNNGTYSTTTRDYNQFDNEQDCLAQPYSYNGCTLNPNGKFTLTAVY